MSHTDCVCGQHAEIAAQRAEIKRMCEERDSAQRCIEKLTGRVGKLATALLRTHIETLADGSPCWCAHEPHQPACESARAALAALEVPRG